MSTPRSAEFDVQTMVESLRHMQPLSLDLDPAVAFQLVSTIQLACRHPNFDGPTRETIEELARSISYFPAELQPVIAAGWDPEHDVIIPRCRVCGCTEDDCTACTIKLGGEPCHWVEPDLCSACAAQHILIV
jgi:hypothetical protein